MNKTIKTFSFVLHVYKPYVCSADICPFYISVVRSS